MKKYLFFIFSLALFSSSLFSQTINGKVYSRLTNSPLIGVSTELNGPVQYNNLTDLDGIFTFTGLPPGRYTLKISHVGFVRYQKVFTLNEEDLILEIFLDENLQSLPEVEVLSASRRASSELNLPFASSVLIEPARAENIPRSTPEALSVVPGVFVQKTNHGGGSAFIRGLTGNQTLILVDGIRLNNSTYRYGPNQYLNTVDPFTIQKIEVLKGSGSVQYGSDALGGVIQIFTKDPDFSEDRKLKGSVNARFASAGMEKSGNTEFRYASPKMVFSGILGLRDFGDLIGGDTTGRQSPSGYTETNANLKMKLKLSQNVELIVSNQFVQQKDVDVFHKVRLENYKLNEMGVQERNLSYLRLKMKQTNPLFKQINIIASLNRTNEERNSQRNNNPVSSHEQDKVSTANLSAELFSDFILNRWTANSGLEYYFDKIRSTRSNLDTQSGSLSLLRGLYPNLSSYMNTSVYSLHHIVLGAGFNLEAGLRYNWLKASIKDKDLGDIDVSPAAFVWNSGLNYSLDNHQFYYSLNSGYRAPNIDDMGTLGIVDFRYELPAYALKPEKSYNMELGYRYVASTWSFGTAIYRNKIDNLINRVQTGEIIDTYKVYRKENNEKAVIKGIETTFTWQFNKLWNLDLFASYNHGENLTKAEPLRRVPPLNGNVAINYLPGKFYMKAELAWADLQDRLAQGDKDDNRIPNGGTPAWKVFNIYSGYNFGPAHLRVSAQNLFNIDYRTHGSGINAVGRSLWTSLQFDF